MRLIDADALEELFREVIGGIAKKPEMNGNLEHMVRASAMVIEMIQDAPTIEPERKTGIPRDAIEYILQKETVSTNPYNFTANEKFIKFMDDPEIASFGRWQHANGFNTALVAVKCDLDKIPDSEPERKKGRWIAHPDDTFDEWFCCSVCHKGLTMFDGTYNFCPNCGAEMEEGEEN